jgi:flagellar biogenesis protein FliO
MKNSQHLTSLLTVALAAALTASAAGVGPEDTFIGPMPERAEAPAPKEPVAVPARKDLDVPKPERFVPIDPTPVREPAAFAGEASRDARTPLGSSKPNLESQAAAPTTTTPSAGGLGVTKTVLSLSAVLALIVLIAGVVKKLSGRVGGLAAAIGAGGKAPSGILSILGRYPLDRGTTLILLRADRRVLLLSQSRTGGRFGTSATTLTTLSEFTSEADVASMVAKASAAEGKAPSQRFQQALEDESLTHEEPAPARAIPQPKAAKKQTEHEALAAMLRAAVEASKQERTAAPRQVQQPVARAERTTTQTGADAAAELRTRLAAMRAKAALGVGTRRTEMVA